MFLVMLFESWGRISLKLAVLTTYDHNGKKPEEIWISSCRGVDVELQDNV